MGTRADFYVGRGTEVEWLGSVAWDAYPDGLPDWLKGSGSEPEFRENVHKFLTKRNDATFPSDGWPWPWKDSGTTDYTYAFDEGVVWASHFGSPWWSPPDAEPEWDDEKDDYADEEFRNSPRPVHPDMSNVQNVTYGSRSGITIIETTSSGGYRVIPKTEIDLEEKMK